MLLVIVLQYYNLIINVCTTSHLHLQYIEFDNFKVAETDTIQMILKSSSFH